ncbi:head GIN domain-containing protein [uncultured Flavobacterium sp.]|uniref:head GIN domain-containing protein n=1 Tax=uncultured Flavobacterium sp. TaxID=165435 RepID=UPI0025F8671B|nr:head GIN domain-containing protein [uncultured Flavobacterium sp.]
MKKTIFKTIIFLLSVVFFSCDSENASDCFQTSGKIIFKEVQVADFNKINISEGIELIIKEGTETKVVIESGQNLLSGITAEVSDGKLFLRNSNGCNLVREYNNTKVFVTTPTLENVYSSSQFAVKSDGVLNFSLLSLQSGMFSNTASGTFELDVNCESLTIEDNKSTFFKISGKATNLSVNFYDGNARFDGSDLIANEVTFFQRSSNDIIVNPINKISGTIYSTGNIVLKNIPPTIEITQLYQGHIVYP